MHYTLPSHLGVAERYGLGAHAARGVPEADLVVVAASHEDDWHGGHGRVLSPTHA
jgi:hypothetical protein